MTLKEKLDAMVKKANDIESLKSEIEAIFLKAPIGYLRNGIRMRIFYNDAHTELQYAIPYEVRDKSFEQYYGSDVLKEVVSIMKSEGMSVSDDDDDYISITYGCKA